MTRARGVSIGLSAFLVAAACLIPTGAGSAATCSWSVVPSIDGGPVSELTAVASLSRGFPDVWAVGNTSSGDEFAASHPLLERYQGAGWTLVPGPHSGSRSIADVSIIADNDAWVVGSFLPRPGSRYMVDRTLAEFFDGTSWKTVSTPNAGDHGSDLAAIWERVPGDVWAVGSSTNKSGLSRALIEHYDGLAHLWSISRTPKSRKFARSLTDVFANAVDRAWAVGYERSVKSPGSGERPLMFQWNGSLWTKVRVPSPPANSRFTSIVGNQFEGSTVTLIGNYVSGGITHAFSYTYDGTTWTPRPTAAVGASDRLEEVGSGAAGSYIDGTGHSHPLIEFLQGPSTTSLAWVQQPVEDAPSGNGWLNGISASSSALFAVGGQSVPNSTTFVPETRTLIEHYSCTTSSPTPSPSSSATSTPSPNGSATATP